MVLEALPKPAGARPPTFGGPPVGTTFSNDPDDRDDMIVHLRDNVERLVRQAEKAEKAEIANYMRLLQQRRNWIQGEIEVEGMLSEAPKAPLGIPENIYDLATLTIEPTDERRRQYDRMIELIDRTMAHLWDRMMTSEA